MCNRMQALWTYLMKQLARRFRWAETLENACREVF